MVARSSNAPIVFLLLLSAVLTSAETPAAPDGTAPVEETAPIDELRLEPAAVPTATYNSDEGFGTGGVGTLYFHQGGVLPYKAALTLNLFLSTRLVQQHRVRLEALQLFGLPMRALAQIGYFSTVTQNFCGYGNAVTCDAHEARVAAEVAGISPNTAAFDDSVRQYHRMRFIRLWGEGLFRYALRDKPHRVEVWGGWRGSYYLPGEVRAQGIVDGRWFEVGPYPVSRWAHRFAHGEPGFSSALQLGATFDDRDEETQPSSGYFVEASVRAAAPAIGSTWTWAGSNLTTAVYAPLVWGSLSEGADLVLASRVIVDVMVGDPSTEDLARTGGLTDAIAFGGSDLGRGIREHRYLGKVKLMSQTELRWSFAELLWLEQRLKLGLAGFLDAAALGYDLFDWRGEPFGVVGGVGAGFRVLWNRNFSVRLDVGVSPHEAFEPRVYIRVGNPF